MLQFFYNYVDDLLGAYLIELWANWLSYYFFCNEFEVMDIKSRFLLLESSMLNYFSKVSNRSIHLFFNPRLFDTRE